jgi:hypothetical protein
MCEKWVSVPNVCKVRQRPETEQENFNKTCSGKFGKPKVASQVQALKIQQNVKKKY